MKKSCVVLGVIALLPVSIRAAGAEKSAVPFRDITFEAATKAAEAEGKLVFIDFYTTWCGPCKILDAQTWTNAAVGQLVGDKTVPLKIDAEKQVDLAKRYKIAAYPTLLLVKPDGAEVDRLIGFRPADTFLAEFNKLLTSAKSGQTPLEQAQAAVTTADSDDAQPHYALAEQLIRAGNSEEALKELLWCWEEGKRDVEFARTIRTRRLPMTLASLGREYAPAKEALVKLRDQSHQRAVAGKGGGATIDELIQLNKALRDDEDTLAVFDQIPPGDSRRGTISIYVFDALVAKKRYADALIAYRPESSLQMLARKPSPQMVERFGEAQAREMQHSTLMYVARRVEPLIGAGRDDDARELATKLLEIEPSDEVKNFLRDAGARAGKPDFFKDLVPAAAPKPEAATPASAAKS